MRDAALGHADAVGAYAQFRGHRQRRLVIDRGAPEGLPGCRLELAAKLQEGAADQG